MRLGRRVVPQIYNPHTADEWKARVEIIARHYKPLVPLTGPVRLSATFLLPRPMTHYKRGVLRPDAPQWHFCKPDGDNFQKALLDALTAAKMWHDDSQVADQQIRKLYTPEADDPTGCFISLQAITTSPLIHELCQP
jgi:Holliday junction resolvase RusA-like endonuclease